MQTSGEEVQGDIKHSGSVKIIPLLKINQLSDLQIRKQRDERDLLMLSNPWWESTKGALRLEINQKRLFAGSAPIQDS